MNKREVPVAPAPEVAAENGAAPAATNAAGDPQAGGNIAMTAEEQAALMKEKDLDAVNDALGSGQGDPLAMLEVANRLENPDAEVRTAAREAAIHLGDTNIIPYLTSALSNLQDPREKVAILDAIEYLQIPTAPSGPPDPALEAMMSNAAASAQFGTPPKRRAPPKVNRAPAPAPGAPVQPPAVAPQGTP